MTSINEKSSIVWSKGDVCLSPYSGDNELYHGVIQQIRRSATGNVLALVKFDGYTEDDSEEVSVDQLEKVKEKLKSCTGKTKQNDQTPVSKGMFSPLQGSELSQRLKAKYAESDEEDFSIKSEKLSAVLFGKPGTSNEASTSRNQSRKAGERTSLKGQSKNQTPDKPSIDDMKSPMSGRRKFPLDVTGGQAKDFQKELFSSKRLSDISSIVDSGTVKKALEKHSHGADKDRSESDKKQFTHRSHSLSSTEGEDSYNSGFNDEDMEKPKFTFKAEGAKVPFVLSEGMEIPVVQVPATLNQYLRNYQREGIQFMYEHYKNNEGAILGDDMGLGKTVQVIGFLSALLGKQGNRVDVMRQKPSFIRKLSDSASVRTDAPNHGPFLIIGPGCVLYNWLEEFETWGYFSVRKYHGSDKAECMRELERGKIEIVITTFETFREHMDDLNSVEWDAVLVDEVHKIKDMKARTTKALREIKTSKRYGLTGTALQNNLMEFWSILDWACPGCLGNQADFQNEFVRPIEIGQRHDATKRELATARKQKDRLAEIRRKLMIRRMKSLIADQLPRKDDSVVFCKLSQLQVGIYKTILDQPGMEVVIHGDDPCHCHSGEPQSKCCMKKAPDGQSVRSLRFTFMHLLLKTANHVALLIPTQKTSSKQTDRSRKICEEALSKHPQFVSQTREASFKTLSDPKYCGKMKVLQGLLKVFYREHSKVLVFSYSTQVLDIIEQYLMSTEYEYRRIDGTVSSKKRMIVVHEFNTDPSIFICLISTKAGGLGLNLTGANKVVIFDPNWNPTHDLQAQDRAYRIGQRRNVQVYRLVSTGTIEENMYLRQIYKQQLLNVTVEDENARRYFYAVQGNPKQKGELFGMKNMFILRTGGSCITRDIIKRNERVESALEGFDTAQYIPPVVRLDEDEKYEDTVTQESSTENTQSEDLFAQLFSSDESDNEVNGSDGGENTDRKSSDRQGENSNCQIRNKGKGSKLENTDIEELVTLDSDSECDESEVKAAVNKKGTETEPVRNKRQSVRFVEPVRGKVKPWESKTGKGPLKRNSRQMDEIDSEGEEDGVLQYDQTLAGTFTDVSDVFDNCGVVHIHRNVKVVGGSRAEDHMSKCAISDVYDLHQHSQELAAQCEPMSESSEEESPVPCKKRRGRVTSLEDHNTVRSTIIGNTNILIGQTPKAFKMRYFEELAKQQHFESQLEFAEKVLSSSLEERIKILNSFYGSKDPALADIHQLKSSEILRSVNRTANTSSTKKKEKLINRSRQKSTAKSHKAKVCQSIAFIDNIEPESESLSQSRERTDLTGEDSSIEVGRKIMPRKPGQRSHNRRTTNKGNDRSKPVHEPVPPSYLNVCDDTLSDSWQVMDGGNGENNSEHSEDLLDEISRIDEQNEEVTEDKDRDILHREERKVSGTSPRKNTIETSVLDDIFGAGDRTVNRIKKPPPSQKVKFNSPSKNRCIREKREEKTPKGLADDPFRLVDEIFGDKCKPADNSTKRGNDRISQKPEKHGGDECDNGNIGDEMFLETSTLKDDQFDCFDDPRLWKKRKRKEPDKRSTVDMLIEASNADFNDLFTSGKLKRKTSKPGTHNKKQSCESIVDGSASLFS